MSKHFKSIDEIMSKDKAFEKIRKTAKAYDIVSEFKLIFPELKEVTKAVKFDNGTLFLKTQNSVWRSELNFMSREIREKINRYFKEELVNSIKFI